MVTLCIGGSILAPDEPNVDVIRKAAKTIRTLKSEKHTVLVVTGGGGIARRFIRVAKVLGASSFHLDKIGIEITRLNARMLISALGDIAEQEPITTIEAAIAVVLKNKVPVMGGTTPGQTTDAVAAMLAKASRSDLLVFFSDVDGVYTSDPKLNPSAKKIERMTAGELVKKFGSVKSKPGMRTIIDPVAVKLIERGKFKTLVLGPHEIKRLPEILKGGAHSGTTIVPVSE